MQVAVSFQYFLINNDANWYEKFSIQIQLLYVARIMDNQYVRSRAYIAYIEHVTNEDKSKVIIQHSGYCEDVISVKEIKFSMVCTCI